LERDALFTCNDPFVGLRQLIDAFLLLFWSLTQHVLHEFSFVREIHELSGGSCCSAGMYVSSLKLSFFISRRRFDFVLLLSASERLFGSLLVKQISVEPLAVLAPS